MAFPKYYETIEELEGKTKDVDGLAEFDFSILENKSPTARFSSWLIGRRWLYAILRNVAPVLKIGNLYLATRYDDVAYVRKHDALFEAPYGREMKALTNGVNFLLGMDKTSGHQRQLEFILGRKNEWEGVIRPSDIDEIIVPQVRKCAGQLLDCAGGEIDVIQDYLTRISAEVCAYYYGLEPDDPDAFARWLMSLSALLFADYGGEEAVRRLALVGAKRVETLVRKSIEKARLALDPAAPKDALCDQPGYEAWIENTVIGRLVSLQLERNGEPSDDEIVAMIIGLAVGFVPTGAAAGGNILQVLFEKKARLREAQEAARNGDDEKLGDILDEALRFKPPIFPGLPRYVVRQAAPGEHEAANPRIDKIPQGATILVASASAMFDGRALGADISKFKPGRKLPKPDLQFGGADNLHYCFGEKIFRAVALESFKALLPFEDLRPKPGKEHRLHKAGPFPQRWTFTYKPANGHRSQSLITICVPLAPDANIEEINAKLDRLGNPAGEPLRRMLDQSTLIHFAHMTAIPPQADEGGATRDHGHLLVELNADGPSENAVRAFVECACKAPGFNDVFIEAAGIGGAKAISELLLAHHYKLKAAPWPLGAGKTSGLNFEGAPGLSVKQIESDRILEKKARSLLDEFVQKNAATGIMPSAAIAFIRRRIKHSPLGDELVRPSRQELAVSRRANLELSETISRLRKDQGLKTTLLIGLVLSWLIFAVFLRGNFPTEPSWGLIGRSALAVISIFSSFALGTIATLAVFAAAAVYRRPPKSPFLSRIIDHCKAHRTQIIAVSALAGLAHIVFFNRWLGLETWDAAQLSHLQRLNTVGAVIGAALTSIVIATIILAVLVSIVIFDLRRLLKISEDGNPPSDDDISLSKYQDIMRKENNPDYVQNHILLVTPLKGKPRWLRRLALSTGFYFIVKLVQHRFRPGFVLDIGTIHFARWFVLPKSHTMVFFSNYDGSGESYFEDFVTKAKWGQTGVWSNALGFPKTRDLLFEGAGDATRFKRWIRNNQVVSRFWYSRFPDLTTAQIRRNALICEGLAKARTDTEFRAWIDMMGSRPRPANALETREIQSVILSGMGKLKSAAMMAVAFPEDTPENNSKLAAWLERVSGYNLLDNEDLAQQSYATFDEPQFDVAYNEPSCKNAEKRPRQKHAMNIAFSNTGLQRLGLDRIRHTDNGKISSALDSFPAAFRSGMTSRDRKQILHDVDKNDSDHWDWGSGDSVDAVLLIYAKDKAALKNQLKIEEAGLARSGVKLVKTLRTKMLPKDATHMTEAFGFRDGVSQPVIKGGGKYHEGANPLHVVEPGEFILGYEDNAGYHPATPVVNAHAPGAHFLPSLPDKMPDRFPAFSSDPNYAPKDLGRNGSFLVIRQLQQNDTKFASYLERQARILRARYGLDHITPEWLGAKLVGRWKDGSSLFRHPAQSKSAGSDYPSTESEKDENCNADNVPGSKKDSSSSKDDTSDNDFLPGVDDPQGLRCPYGAHVRRVNPRDSLAPGSKKQIEISNRHRILRRGRPYENNKEKGLLFMCLNSNIERQFEFIQQTWLNSTTFHGLRDETDTLARHFAGGSFTIPTSAGPVRMKSLQSFVRVKGGGYFFMPSRAAIRFLATHVKEASK